ncbi:hypothetical protein PF002_g431 [Phytophthora fragariae]|nr:hypothetical protein PF002_g431 [Phytophthora fragariae]
MAKVARRRAMPHHRVPEPKEASPIFERLRSELNWKVRHRVCEAVDAVCIAFEDELAQLMQPAVPQDYSYELFYDCCSRLTRFIESNMSTTPGFMVEMDRLIFACHSGASVRTAMTKDLQIRRRQQSEDTEASVEGDIDQPASSRGNAAIAKKKAVATGGDEDGASSDNSAPVGTASRQWVTRKRLSTRSHSSGAKRLKRWADSGRKEFEMEKKQQDVVKEDADNEEARNEGNEAVGNETKQQICARASSMKMRSGKLTLKRDKCVRRLENDFGDEPGNMQDAGDDETESSQVKHVGKPARLGGARRKRWSLRKISKLATELCAPKQQDEGSEVGSQISEEIQASARKVVALNEKGAVTGSRTNADMAKGGNQGTGTVPMESTQVSTTPSEPKQSDKTDDIKPQTSSSPIDRDLTKEGRYLAAVDGDEEDMTSNGSESGLEHVVAVIPKKNETSEEDQKEKNDRSGAVGDFEQAHLSEAVQATEQESECAVVNDMGNVSTVESTRQTKDESQAHDQEDNRIAGEGAVSTKTHTEHDDLEYLHVVATDGLDETANPESQEAYHASVMDSSNEPPVPGLCDAGMRPAHEVSQFKDWLRKSIQFVDAVLCKPPPGKACFRDCKNIRERQCIEGVSCRDELCRNWHNAEAHTERCTNPLCEFRNRILLREIMHQIANLDVDFQALQSQWENKTLELIVATTTNSNRLNDDIKELERSIDDAKEEMESLKNKRRILLANLSAIGVTPEDDEVDRFPDFESHYI